MVRHMELLRQALDIFLHVDDHLLQLVVDYGAWVYAILFVIIFCETGLVVTPFLPGDSLLFAAGALAAGTAGAAGDAPGISLLVLVPLLIVAAILGDAVNYTVGWKVGPGFLEKGKVRFIKTSHLERTQRFYEKYGGKTIILARFVPIVRTFAPFVAGIGRMDYRRFASFNVIGAIAWVVICSGAGFFFGNIPVVKENFELVLLGIIFVSVLPIGVELLRGFLAERKAAT
jgi:membrane-associated protein